MMESLRSITPLARGLVVAAWTVLVCEAVPVTKGVARPILVSHPAGVVNLTNSITCSMCKELLPYVGPHECTEECEELWSWV